MKQGWINLSLNRCKTAHIKISWAFLLSGTLKNCMIAFLVFAANSLVLAQDDSKTAVVSPDNKLLYTAGKGVCVWNSYSPYFDCIGGINNEENDNNNVTTNNYYESECFWI